MAIDNAPKNRSAESLPILRIEVESKDGLLVLNPLQATLHAIVGNYPLGPPFETLLSCLSGKPSYAYRAEDVELALTFDELDRFCRHALRPAEFKAVLARFGEFLEIHGDWYDAVSGAALLPIPKGAALAQNKARVGALAQRSMLESFVEKAKVKLRKAGL